MVILDNEISGDFKQSLAKKGIQYQLVPPHVHRRNAAERAIRTFKNHFLAGLASVDPNYPIHEWDRLIPQAELTLNLLRNARANKALSAYAYLFGPFLFNSTPLAPPGTKVVVHSKPDQRASWAYHGELGWYIGPSLTHYRCVRCYIPETRREKDTDTVQYFSHDNSIPTTTIDDHLKNALQTISTILHDKDFKNANPILNMSDDTISALQQLTTILKTSTKPPDWEDIIAPHGKDEPVQTNNNDTGSVPRVVGNSTPLPKPIENNMSHQNTNISKHVNDKQNGTFRDLTKQHAEHDNQLFRQIMQARLTKRAIGIPRLTTTNKLQHHFVNSTMEKLFHIYNGATGQKETIDSLLNGDNPYVWNCALSNEWGRLANGNSRVEGTNTIQFIAQCEVPMGKKVTYATIVCDYRLLKTEQWRCRLVVGGDKLFYNEDTGAPAASLLDTKILLNSIISDSSKGARFMTCDIKNYFLGTKMKDPEYMKVPYKYFPEDIRIKYNLHKIVSQDNHIYIKINKGMYGLKQAAVLAHTQLIANLKEDGYRPIPHIEGFWEHESRLTKFCLCVDDFGIKYYSKADADHLLSSLRKNYEITVDWKGTNYCGLSLKWDYINGTVDISMPGYIDSLLHKLKHPTPKRYNEIPYPYNKPVYGRQQQKATQQDTSPKLDAKDTLHVQSVIGSLLYYCRALDLTIHPALNELSTQQSKATKNTKKLVKDLLDYMYTFPETIIRYHKSDMVLHVDSDAALLVLPKAKSRIAGYFHLSSYPSKYTQPNPMTNGAILVECKTIDHVVTSAAEAEMSGIYHNTKTALMIRNILNALGHHQPPTPIKTDNATANAFIHNNIKQKRSKSWDMRYWWLRENIVKKIFNIFWEPEKKNLADYFTKHHSKIHHQVMRQKYIYDSPRAKTSILSTS